MPSSARLTDIWAGICCCHPPIPCIGMAGPIITSSTDDQSGNLGTARLTDMTIGYCGHPGIIVTSAPGCRANSLGKARIGDSVVGCNIGTIVTGNPTHDVGNAVSGCGGAAPPPSITVEFQGQSVQFTEVDYGNIDDDPDGDDGLNIYPPLTPVLDSTTGEYVFPTPTPEQQAESDALDVSPTAQVDEDIVPPLDSTTPITACIDIPPSFPDDFALTSQYTLGQLSTQTVLSKNRVRAQHGFTKEDIVCNLQAWAQNIGDPLAAYTGRGNMMITSGFRIGGGRSQHERGMAADIQYPGKTNTEVYNIAVWIKDNLPFDQLILEYGGNRPWIHVSFNRFGNRPSTAGNKYGTRVSPGNYVWGSIKNLS